MAGNSTFRGIIVCNLGTPKQVISNFVTTRQIDTPYSSQCKYDYPNNVPVGQKTSLWKKNPEDKKSLGQKCINSFLAHTCYLTINGYESGHNWESPRRGLHFGAGCQQAPDKLQTEILCRATVLIYLQGITAKNFYYSYVKKHRRRWELVGSLSGDCWLPVPKWSPGLGDFLNCDRTRSMFFLGGALTGPYPTMRFGGACGLGVGAW